MANKNYAGNILRRTKNHEERLVKCIDTRSRKGIYDVEQAQNKALNYQVGRDGSRKWTF